jgi:L-rhamnose isomerase
VWDYYCLRQGVLVGMGYMDDIRGYERQVLAKRV